jgi:hypothetical protein
VMEVYLRVLTLHAVGIRYSLRALILACGAV